MPEKEEKYQVRVDLWGFFFLVLCLEKSVYSSLPERVCKIFAIFY